MISFTLVRSFNKKRAHDPIDYESIYDIEFWIMEEDTNDTSIIDFNEIETLLYNGKSIHTVGLDNEQGENEILLMCIFFYYGMLIYEYARLNDLLTILS